MSENASAPSGAAADDPAGRRWGLRPAEIRRITAAGLVLAAASAIVQIAGTAGESPVRSITLAAITIVTGVAALVLATRLVPAWKHRVTVNVLVASCVLVATGVAGYLISHISNPRPPAGSSAAAPPRNSASPAVSHSATPAAAHSASTKPARLYSEITDNMQGTQVFSDPQGGAVTSHGLIRYDTHVDVRCWVKNESTMSSINAFYLVESPPWTGDYAPANTFGNGDPVGQPGSTTIDPAVPECD